MSNTPKTNARIEYQIAENDKLRAQGVSYQDRRYHTLMIRGGKKWLELYKKGEIIQYKPMSDEERSRALEKSFQSVQEVIEEIYKERPWMKELAEQKP